MSEPRSALNGAHFAGFATIAEAAPRGMITLRGDLSDAAFQTAVAKVSGVAVPDRLKIATKGEYALAWMSPDELLLLCPYAEVARITQDLTKALAGSHYLIANVSDARALFAVAGSDAREVIAKLSPADVSPGAFGPGQMRRTRLAQVPAAFWMSDDTTFQIVCFRSVAQYVFDLLRLSAQPGSEVDFY